MSAQPKRAPEPDAPAPEVPRLRRRADLRAATDADRPAAGEGEVSRLQGRVAGAFGGEARSKTVDLMIKLLIVAATCLFVGAALVRSAPFLASVVG